MNTNNISYINCPMPRGMSSLGESYSVKGDGHPNYLSHAATSECINKYLKKKF